ncbi:helix-turn-helix transcriptional regulator [Demetria terragena]|uniref:helix-turn-helix transcriptional regulator n=1 Tax=Demetria terragena TaxID=63959 RepID=UPI00039F906F|nr:LuxR C-terminal-related transcriptional regulator [Demetria terragena]
MTVSAKSRPERVRAEEDRVLALSPSSGVLGSGEDLAEPQTVQAVLDAVTDSTRAEGALVIVNGAPGASCTGVLRRTVSARGRPSLWVHAMPGADDGEQGCMGQWVSVGDEGAEVATTPTPESGATMAEFLQSVDGHLGHDTVVVVDNFHLLTPASANALLVWSQVARVHGATLLMGYHASLDAAGVGALLTMATDVRWIDLRWKSDAEARAFLRDASEWSHDDLLEVAVAASGGNPEMLRCVKRAIGQEPVVHADQWPRFHRQALEAFGLYVLSQQDQDAQVLARVVAWVYPELSVSDVAQNLGLDSHVAVRVERLLRELALVSDHPAVMSEIRSALHDHTSTAMRRRCAQAARAMLTDQDATRCAHFEMVAEAAEDLTGSGCLAEEAYEEALASGRADRAAEIATRVFARSTDEQERSWASRAQLRVWLRHDWSRAAAQLTKIDSSSIESDLDLTGISPLFGLESGLAATVLLNTCVDIDPRVQSEARVWAGQDSPGVSAPDARDSAAYATFLALSAFAGKSTSTQLAELDASCSAGGAWLDTDACLANRLALAWLALADYERAQQWAALATFNAAPDEHPERGLGHLVRAQSLLRQGELARAREEARAARSEFEEIRAGNLSAVAALTLAHATLEEREDPGVLADFVGDDVHPLFSAYRRYVQARHSLLLGAHQEAVRQLFETGRSLQKVCPNNPSLTNWRLHLSAVFRATGQREFLEHIEQDIVRSWRQWAQEEPEAVGRRSVVLGRLAEEVLTNSGDRVGLEALSPAERRVVDVVAQGMSNREVAKFLFLSKRTVDTHLGNVYRKLQIESRDQLSALVAADCSGSTTELVAFG